MGGLLGLAWTFVWVRFLAGGGGLRGAPAEPRRAVGRWRGGALAPGGSGLVAAGVYTRARAAGHVWVTTALATAATVALAARWLPPVVVVLAGGLAGWLVGL